MGLLVGGVAAGLPPEQTAGALWGTLTTGAAFVGIELFQAPIFLVQLKGIAVLAKFMLLIVAVEIPSAALPAMILAIIIGGISSHMPGKYRYYSIVHRRVIHGPSG